MKVYELMSKLEKMPAGLTVKISLIRNDTVK